MHGVLETPRGLRDATTREVDEPEVIVCGRIAGLRAYRALEAVERLVSALLAIENDAELVECLRPVGRTRDCRTQVGFRLRQPLQQMVEPAAVVPGLGGRGVELDRAGELLQRLAMFAALQQQAAERMRAGGVPRRDRHGATQRALGDVEAPRRLVDAAEQSQRVDAVRCASQYLETGGAGLLFASLSVQASGARERRNEPNDRNLRGMPENAQGPGNNNQADRADRREERLENRGRQGPPNAGPQPNGNVERAVERPGRDRPDNNGRQNGPVERAAVRGGGNNPGAVQPARARQEEAAPAKADSTDTEESREAARNARREEAAAKAAERRRNR